MVDRIVFHLGDPGTGAAIQAALRAGVVAGGRRIAFPVRGEHHGNLAAALIQGATPIPDIQPFKALARMVGNLRAPVAVVSADQFERVDPKALRRAIAAHLPDHADTVQLVAYVRPHADRLLAAWADARMFGGADGGVGPVFRALRGDLRCAKRFLAWRAVFGDAFALRPVLPDRLAGGLVVSDFLDLVSGGADFRLPEGLPSDALPTVQDMAVMAIFAQELDRVYVGADAPEQQQSRRALERGLAAVLQALPRAGATPLALHRGLAQRVRDACAEDAAALDAAFFDGAPMTAALDAAVAHAVDEEQGLALPKALSGPERRLARNVTSFMANMALSDLDGWAGYFAALRAGSLPWQQPAKKRAGGTGKDG